MNTAVEAVPAGQPATNRIYTYDELVAEMPETNQPHELWDGVLIMSPTSSFFHQEISGRFYIALHNWAKKHNLGKVVASPLDMVLSPHQTVQPDIAYVSRE